MAANDPEAGQRQKEEIEALSAIYGDEWCVVNEEEKIFCIKISECLEQPKWTLCLQVILPPEYPTAAPPIYQINAPWLQRQEYEELANSLEEIYIQNLGESILYQWIEKLREFLIEKSQTSDLGPDVKKSTEEIGVEYEDFQLNEQPLQECTTLTLDFNLFESLEGEELPPVYHGNPITDRRSTFQAHLAPIVSPKQVKSVLAELYKNKKIANATHNIYAYRIYCEDKQTFLQDCEDDGETAAGGRLLHLMQVSMAYTQCDKVTCTSKSQKEAINQWQFAATSDIIPVQILDVRNVLVVVSRWYGGILLGPDRFKHINNCARNILVEQKYTYSSENLSKQLGKNRKIKKDKKKMEH